MPENMKQINKHWFEVFSDDRCFYAMYCWVGQIGSNILSLTADKDVQGRWWYASDILSFGDFEADSLEEAMWFCEDMYLDYLQKQVEHIQKLIDNWDKEESDADSVITHC